VADGTELMSMLGVNARISRSYFAIRFSPTKAEVFKLVKPSSAFSTVF
jgi:hypothetical protein